TKKAKKELTTIPIAIASTLIGIVTINTIAIIGNFAKSTFRNKSERPTALRIFILITLIGVTTLAIASHCNSGIVPNHFSPNNTNIMGLAINAINTIVGKVIKAVIFIKRLYTETI